MVAALNRLKYYSGGNLIVPGKDVQVSSKQYVSDRGQRLVVFIR